MNSEIFRLINNLAGKNLFLDQVMILCSKYGPHLFILTVFFVFILGLIKQKIEYRNASVSTIVITIISLIITFIVGHIYYVDRPFVNNKVNLLFPHKINSSFPSSHATGTMSIACGILGWNKVLGIILTFLSIMVGLSRIYVGHHYPADVIFGYLIVFITSYFYSLFLRNYVEKIYTKIEIFLISKFKPNKNYK